MRRTRPGMVFGLECRVARLAEVTMDALRQDLAFARRWLARSPGFAATAVLTLALGVAASTAMFSVVNAALFRPLPYRQPGELVRITGDYRKAGAQDVGASQPELQDFRGLSDTFADVAGVFPIDANLTGTERPERVETLLVSPNYFSLLGVRPALGRLFGPEDDAPGIAEVAVISDALWRRGFGSDAAVV